MMTITDMLMIALFIEAIVNALKPIWQEDGEKMTASEYVAMGFGVIFAVSCKINMLAYVVDVETAPWMNYFFYALTGIAIGRGTNFLYDLWEKMKQWQGKELIALDGVQQMHVAPAKTVNLDMAKWNLEALESFCAANGIDMTGCETKEDYMTQSSGNSKPKTERKQERPGRVKSPAGALFFCVFGRMVIRWIALRG